MTDQQWIAYQRHRSADIIRRADEKAPVGYHARPTLPTADEIDAEVKRLEARVETKRRYDEFNARQDYQDASAVRSAIEFISCTRPARSGVITPSPML